MATFTILTDAVLTSGKAFTQLIARAYRDNLTAVIEDDASAPDIIGLDPLAEVIISGVATVEFLSLITSAHDHYYFAYIDVVPVTDAQIFQMQFSVDNGSTWITTSTYKEAGGFYY